MVDAADIRMDRMYRFQRHIYDLTRRYYLLGRKSLIHGLVPPEDGNVLEIGCGTAWNLIEAARTYPLARFHGFDVSEMMLSTARRNVARAGLCDRISLTHADAVASSDELLFANGLYDRVFASYVLSMIPDWQRAIEHGIALLAPGGGSLHIVDFGAAEGLPAAARFALRGWLARFDVTPRSTLRREIERLAGRHGLQSFHTELYGGYAQYAVLSRYGT